MIDRPAATAQVLEMLESNDLHGWTLAWTRAKRAFGSCDYATHTIKLSWPITRLNTPDELHATVLHEIAHAKAGPDAGHGPAWRHQCRLLGIPPVRCVGPDVAVPQDAGSGPARPVVGRSAGCSCARPHEQPVARTATPPTTRHSVSHGPATPTSTQIPPHPLTSTVYKT